MAIMQQDDDNTHSDKKQQKMHNDQAIYMKLYSYFTTVTLA